MLITYETWLMLTDHALDVAEMTGDLFAGPMTFGDWEAEADEIESTRPSELPPRYREVSAL